MDHSDEAPTLPRTWVTSPALRAGDRRFGRFVLEALAGRGGMSVVWKARDELLGETIALKFLPDQLTGDPRALADLRAETRRARQLSHPHIVRIYEFFSDEFSAAVAMEFVEGRSLAAEIAQHGTLAPEQILAWLPDLAAALDYAHREAKVVHRDLKPGNVLLPSAGGAKLADFGISCRITETASRCTHLLAGGTLAYMSPQQLSGEEPSPADDMYALGALLYELVTGRPPFTGGDLSFQIRERAPAPPSRWREANAPRLPAGWDESILACLKKKTTDRPASAGEVAAALQGMRLKSRKRWSRPASIVAGVVLLAVTIGAAVFRNPARGAAASKITVAESSSAAELPPLAAPELVRGSLALNLVADLPLDGDHLNYAGDRGRANLVGMRWTEDRFGRKESAMLLTGRNHLELPLGAAFRLGSGTRFTLMAWVRIDDGDGAALSLLSAAAGDVWVQLSCLDKHLCGRMRSSRSYLDLKAESPLADGRWHHVALAFDGAVVRTYFDGEPVAESAWEYRAAPVANLALVVGPKDFSILDSFLRGAVDDVRLYRGGVVPDALLSVAREEPTPVPDRMETNWFPWERATALALTRGRYLQTEGWDTAVARELGAGARVADWTDLITFSGKWPRLAAEFAALSLQNSAHVTRHGEQVFCADRTYAVTRFDGVVGDSFLEHAETGNHTLILGSWNEPPLRIMACVPTAGRYRVESVAINGREPLPDNGRWIRDDQDVWRRVSSDLGSEDQFCLRLPVNFAVAQDSRVTIDLAVRSGDAWHIAIEPGAQPNDCRLRIRRAGGNIDNQVEFAMNPTPHELVVVGRRGHLYVAVVDSKNGAWRGDLAMDSDGFATDALTEIVVSDISPGTDVGGGGQVFQWVVWR